MDKLVCIVHLYVIISPFILAHIINVCVCVMMKSWWCRLPRYLHTNLCTCNCNASTPRNKFWKIGWYTVRASLKKFWARTLSKAYKDWKVFGHMSVQDNICSDICQKWSDISRNIIFCLGDLYRSTPKVLENVRCPTVISCSVK